MKVHHLNCCTFNPRFKGFLFGKVPKEDQKMVCHCLLVETNEGLVLVDTGLGVADVEGSRISGAFRFAARPSRLIEETAQAQVQALGFELSDVRHIVVTHLDLDHAGGLSDFPKAKVHLMRAEHEAAMARKGMDKARYVPAQWAHGVDWSIHDPDAGERWRGLEKVRLLPGIAPELLMVPMPGHSRGHSAVAVQTDDGWLVHCGDAYFHRDEMDPKRPRCTAGLRWFQNRVQVDKEARIGNQARLRELGKDKDITLFSAHDAVEFRRLAGT